MKLFNQLMTLLLSIALLTQGMPIVHAQDKKVDEWEEELKEVSELKEPLKSENGCSNKPVNGKCCSAMVLSGDSCVLNPPFDPTLTSCNSPGECSDGKGCLAQTSKDIFSNIPNEENRLTMKLELETFLNNRNNGSECKSNLDCASYNCVSDFKTGSICKTKTVCRYLHEGETSIAGVKCGLGLELEKGACVTKLEAVAPVGEYDDGGKDVFEVYREKGCEIKFDDELKQAGLIAIRAIRGMEWYFATMNDGVKECTGAPKELKKIGEELQKARQPLVEQLSIQLNNIEADFKKLMAASWKYAKPEVVSGKEAVETKKVQIHQDTNVKETISDQDLASRQTSGYDTLLMMQRRTTAFMEYEMGMLGVLGEFAERIKSGGETAEKLTCPDGKPQYKVRPFIKWKTKEWSGMDQWYMQYEVKGASGNTEITKKKEVAEALSLISGENVKEGSGEGVQPPAAFTKQHYLLDPVPFSGIKLSGPQKELKKKGGFLGLPIFGGFKDLRNAAYINGSGGSSYTAMYEPLLEKLLAFYQKLRSSGEVRLIYEPELQTPGYKFTKDEKGNVIKRPIVLGRNCIEEPGQIQYRYVRSGDPIEYPVVEKVLEEKDRDITDNLSSYEFDFLKAKGEKVKLQKIEVCADFMKFIEGVKGEGFAQFLAYGHSPTESYNLTSQDNFRRKLFAKLMVDFSNLKTYYENLVKVRQEQFACIESVMKGLDNSGILDPIDGGIIPGASTNFSGGTRPETVSFLTKDGKRLKTEVSKFKRTPFKPQFRFGTLKNINNKTNSDGIGEFGNLGGSGSISAASGSSFAILKDKLKKSTNKARAEGTDVEGKKKEYKKLLSSLYQGGAGQSSLGNGQGGSGNLGTFSPGAAKLGGDLKSAEISGPKGEGHKGLRTESTAGAQSGLGTNSGSSGGGSNGSAYGGLGNDGSGSNTTADASGLSDDQKNAMFDEYERNKKDYKGSEEDSLFQTVSKAYVRNLEKILKKKKTEEDR